MLDQKLIGWIKSEEAKKIPDIKLRTRLIKEGWPEKDVDYAINLAHKGKVNWMPVLVTFVLSFIFLSFSMGVDFGEGTLIIGLLGGLLVLIYSILIYFNSEKKEHFWELFIINYTSGTVALSLAIILFNLVTLVVFLTKAVLSVYVIGITFAVMIVVLFYLFFISVGFLSKRFLGYFNDEAYFKFKWKLMWLFKADWKQKWTLVKYPLMIILIMLVIIGFVFNAYVQDANKDNSRAFKGVKEQLKQQQSSDLMEIYLEDKNLSNYEHTRVYAIINENNEIYLDQDALKDTSIIYFGCNFKKMECDQMDYNPNLPLEIQIDIEEGDSVLTIYDFFDKEIAYYQGYESNGWISPFSFSEEQMKLSIFNEIKEEENRVFSFILNLNEDSDVTWFNVYDKTRETVVTFVKMGSDLGKFRSKREFAEFEFAAIKEFEENGTFYDKTNSLNEHIVLLQNNVNELNQIFKQKDQLFSSNKFGGWSNMLLTFEDGDYTWVTPFSFDESYQFFIGRWDVLISFGKDLTEVRENRGIILLLTEQFAALENADAEDESIRLKIIEVALAKDLFESCNQYRDGVQVCWKMVLDLTQTPELLTDERNLEEIKREINVS